MARQGCESCRKWKEHCYQEHLDVSRIRFFKLMTGEFAQGISIPENFVSSLKGQISKGFSLKSPSGETWRVGVTKNADELFFTSGWGDFARAHELQENDLLIFTRSGNYSFDVMILDASGCEKVSCFFTGKRDHCMRKLFDEIVGRQVEHCILSDSDDTTTPSRLIESAHRASASKKTGKTKPGKETGSPDSSNFHMKLEAIDEEEQSNDRHADSNCYYSRSASCLTGDEREEIFSLASIQPGNPAFVTVLQKTHIGHKNNFLIIHSGFAADHLEGRSHDILLLRPNRKEKWHVRYYHGSSTRGFNCRHWIKFVRDNRLHKGYICVFELMKGAKKTAMAVHVIKKVDGMFVLVG
uniref:TF-B3 domain-containing protein n=1 Tax=Arundo donax TaxID=35708 RepID=A0A0A9E2X8_ARUDO